jgi:hypothetical protein
MLLGCQAWREVMRGDKGPLGAVSLWSRVPIPLGLPLKLILYMPFKIFAYTSNILKASLNPNEKKQILI